METTIDPARQAAAQRAAERHASAIGAPGAAIAAVEPGTGRIRALVSRRPKELAQLQAGVGQPTPAGQRLQAAGRRRRPGGRARPGQRLEGRNGVRFDLPRETWEVHNLGGDDHHRPDLAAALRDSVNTTFAQLGSGVVRRDDRGAAPGVATSFAPAPPLPPAPLAPPAGPRGPPRKPLSSTRRAGPPARLPAGVDTGPATLARQ